MNHWMLLSSICTSKNLCKLKGVFWWKLFFSGIWFEYHCQMFISYCLIKLNHLPLIQCYRHLGWWLHPTCVDGQELLHWNVASTRLQDAVNLHCLIVCYLIKMKIQINSNNGVIIYRAVLTRHLYRATILVTSNMLSGVFTHSLSYKIKEYIMIILLLRYMTHSFIDIWIPSLHCKLIQ